MTSYRYQTYTDIPDNVITYIMNVAGLENIREISMTEVNNFLVDMSSYYEDYGQKLEDFLDD